ncbi:MAG: hypothetical protein V3W31_05595, partial [Thermodesulfobacteriota bacterium]
RFKEAIEIFEKDMCFTFDPLAMSYYGLCLATSEKDYEQALSLCVIAKNRDPSNPDIFLNLGKVFVLCGHKEAALKAMREGLKADKTHEGLLAELQKISPRRPPPIPFFSRDNPLNRYIGKVSYLWPTAHEEKETKSTATPLDYSHLRTLFNIKY